MTYLRDDAIPLPNGDG